MPVGRTPPRPRSQPELDELRAEVASLRAVLTDYIRENARLFHQAVAGEQCLSDVAQVLQQTTSQPHATMSVVLAMVERGLRAVRPR